MAEKQENRNTTTGETLSKLLDLTVQRVYQLAKDGVIVKLSRNSYDLVQSVRNYVRYLRALTDGTTLSLTDERTRLVKWQADLAKIELERAQGNLVSVEDTKKFLFEKSRTVRDSLLTIPDRVSPILQNISPDEINKILQKEIEQCLEDLTDESKPIL